MKKYLLIMSTVYLMSSNAFGEGLGRITADIKGIKEKFGSAIICFIFDSKNGFLQESKALQIMDAKKNQAGFYCEFDVPMNKEYAIAALQDENGNRMLDKSFIGAPTEGWGSSNNVTHTFRSPDFEESTVLLKDKALTLILNMHY